MKHTRIGMGWLVAALAASACGGQVGEETVVCEPVRTTPLALDDVSELGFTPRALIDAAVRSHAAQLAWADGGTTALTLALSYRDGTAEFQDREWVGDDGGREIAALDCADVVKLGLRVEAATEDGALSETWTVDALATSADALSLSADLEPIAGSLVIDDYAPPGEWQSTRAWIDLVVDAGGVAGTIQGQAAGEDGDVAFAQGFDIASIEPASAALRPGVSLDDAPACDVETACPPGLECVVLRVSPAVGPLCLDPTTACELLDCGDADCLLLESYPAQATCSG